MGAPCERLSGYVCCVCVFRIMAKAFWDTTSLQKVHHTPFFPSDTHTHTLGSWTELPAKVVCVCVEDIPDSRKVQSLVTFCLELPLREGRFDILERASLA